MASTIKLKNGSGAPTTGDLVQGEPALDLTNKRLYTENASGVVIEVGVNPTSITTGNITANGTINLTGATVSNAGSITTADINGGTIDGTVIGGSTAAAITGTTITGTSFVSSGDMTFGDSDKAIFGAGSDLQIYHDGSHSIIADAGSGNLQIRANDFQLLNAANTQNIIRGYDATGAVSLHYGGAEKLATSSSGVYVTGTVTADGLTVETSTDTQGKFSGWSVIGANSSSGAIELGQNSAYQGIMSYVADGNTRFLFDNTYGSTGSTFEFRTNTAATAKTHLKVEGSGDISFYEDTGTTAKFFWDASAERLGVGTTTPNAPVDSQLSGSGGLPVSSGTDQTYGSLRVGATSFNTILDMGSAGASGAWLQASDKTALGTNYSLLLNPNGGNVGIGTSSPSNTLDLRKDTPAFSQTSSSGAYYTTLGTNVDYTKSFVLNNKGSEIITYGDDTGYGLNLNGGASNLIRFTTNATERMRIDSSGNLTLKNTNNIANITTAAITLTGGDGGGTGGQTVNIATTAYIGVLAIASSQSVSALYYINGALATQVVEQNAVDARFSNTSGSNNTANIYVSGSDIVLENNIQATRSFYITFMGKF
jgi:hypothetical protein